MAWNMDSSKPIYVQLVEQISMRIVSGYYAPGMWLPTVRDLAAQVAVNPNTVQKAFAELEKSGLVTVQRTNGRTVTENTELIERMREKMAHSQVENFAKQMKDLGYTKEQIMVFMEHSL